VAEITRKFRCTKCWSEKRQCDKSGLCIECGSDMHRPWPWNAGIIGCPVTGEFHRGGCDHVSAGKRPRQRQP
jgi:hypothetical protein